jgi:hypothetical protein
VGGGIGTTASDTKSTVGGGIGNTASADHATVGGGGGNIASGAASTVGGGQDNTASGTKSTVGGGIGNTASSGASTVSGGDRNTANGTWATVGGGVGNTASGGATVGGGNNNDASGTSATVGGGEDNTATGLFSTVGGGTENTADAAYTTISGGGPSDPNNQTTTNNVVTDDYGTIGGGGNNQAGDAAGTSTDAIYATVGGGQENTASGVSATVPGGYNNIAAGDYSFAAGHTARANHDGAFVWAGDSVLSVASTGDNQFIVRASGGMWLGTNNAVTIPAGRFINTSTGAHLTAGGVWTNGSDAALKENFAAVDPLAILRGVLAMPIQSWNYIAEDDGTLHIGPTAQDFYAAFGLGQDDVSIGTIDADGVALAAIHWLYQVVEDKDARIAELEQANADLEARVSAIEAALAANGNAVNSMSLFNPAMLLGGLLVAAVWLVRGRKS